jgi:Zn-dependent protease
MNIASTLHSISIAAIPVVCAITLHEVAHGRVALRFGDRTAQAQGRLSLNPLRHVDPIGTVLVPIGLMLIGSPFLFGWAKPVPVNPRYFKQPRRDMAWVAVAGPLSNLVMACLWTVLGGLAAQGWFGAGPASDWLYAMAGWGLGINVVLAVFNMLPIPPLDGGRVLAGLLPPAAAYKLDKLEPYGMWIVLGLLYLHVLDFVLSPVMRVLSTLIARVFA